MTSPDTTPPIVTCARGCRTTGMHKPTCKSWKTCPGCLRTPAVDHTVLCVRCHRLFPAALEDLAELWPDMRTGVIRSAAPSESGRVGGGSTPDIGDFWRPAVTGVMAEVVEWLEFVRRLIDGDPRNRIPAWPADNRVVLLALARHAARFLTHHELAAALVDDVLSFQTRAHAALNSSWARRFPLDATCPSEVRDVDVNGVVIDRACGGQLSALLQPADRGRGSLILCSTHPTTHKVPKERWAEVADQIEAARG